MFRSPHQSLPGYHSEKNKLSTEHQNLLDSIPAVYLWISGELVVGEAPSLSFLVLAAL